MGRLACLLILPLAIARPIHAQTTANGSVHGTARDQHGAVLPGVSMSASSRTVPGVYGATTGAGGEYRLADLPPGEYTIVAELDGFTRFLQTQVALRAGLNVTLDFVMTLGPVSETVEVRQDTPLLESRNAVQSVNISGELLRALPLSERREWFGALTLVPGVTTAQWVNNETLVYVHGADSGANIIQIDGADMSPSLVSGVRYVGLNLDSIDDIQIKTAGIDAAAPLGVGGIINIATASGTNHLKAAVAAFVQPRAWNGSNTPGGTSSTVDQRQLDVSLGAPIVKDRLWAFGSYRQSDVNSGVSRTAAQLDALRALLPGFRPFDSTNGAHFWFAKLNAQLSTSHQLAGFYQYDVNPVTFADAVSEHARAEATGGSGASLRISSVWSDRLTTRLGASFNDKRRDGRNPSIDGPLQRVYQSTIVSAGRLVGNGRLVDRGSPATAWNAQPNGKLTLSFDATVVANGRLGSHELQTGVYAQPRIVVGLTTSYVNAGFAFEEAVLRVPGVLDSGVVPFHRLILDRSYLTNAKRRGQDYALYVQDSWRPTRRLTINAGVRVDHVVWTDVLFDVTSQRSTEIGPRFGINYALTTDTRNVVRAHWVRVHDQPSQTAVSVGTSSAGQRDVYDLDLDGTFKTVFVTPPTLGVTLSRSIDPGFHDPFVQEWGIGFDKQFEGRLTAAVDLAHRDYRDRATLVETNGRYNGDVFVGFSDEAFNQIYQLTNNRWNTPVYTSLELSLTKRAPRVEGIASYVRQWRHLAGAWQRNDPASFIQPAAFANDRGIGSPTGSTSQPDDANSLSGTNMAQFATASAQWQDHTARVGVICSGPWRFLVASSYTFQSGAWSGPIISQLRGSDPAFGPATITLSNGRRVTNPLATTFRFAFQTRGDGQLTTPPLHAWNVRIGRSSVWGRYKLDAAVDVFNLTNSGADASFMTGANQIFSPAYGLTTYRQLPRSAQATVRVWF